VAEMNLTGINKTNSTKKNFKTISHLKSKKSWGQPLSWTNLHQLTRTSAWIEPKSSTGEVTGDTIKKLQEWLSKRISVDKDRFKEGITSKNLLMVGNQRGTGRDP